MEWAAMLWTVAAAVVGCLVFACTWGVVEWLWRRPRRLERLLRSQGISGSPYRFPFGDIKEEGRLTREALSKPISPISHCIVPRVAPFMHRTMEQHAKMSMTWLGPRPRVTIMDPEMLREILSSKFWHFQKPRFNPLGKFMSTGVASYEGEEWGARRKILNPAFHIEKLKCKLPAFSSCCDELVSRWENILGSEGSCELDVWPEFLNFTGDAISRAAFGSSFKEGRRLFHLQGEQAKLFIEAVKNLYIPGYRFLPTKKNNRRMEIFREVNTILRSFIEQREKDIREGASTTDDLLGLLIESNLKYSQEDINSHKFRMTTEDVIEECKLFYFAGHETTMVLLTWTMICLSINPNWQARAREEVLQIFGQNKPEFDGLGRLKIVSMIINEVLRLYPPAVKISRRTYKEVKVGDVTFPAGVELLIPIIHVHHDLEIWGEDATEFNPERFAEGVSKASKKQCAFLPFGTGPRTCIGQGFAMLEAKMALATILQHFSFELSPSYAHCPYTIISLQPQYGAQIILHKV